MNNFSKRIYRLLFGIVLYGCGIYLTIQAFIGLAPWEALTIGLTYHTPLSFGALSALIGVAILVADVYLGEKIGVGTIVNTLMIGVVVDIAALVGVAPRMTTFFGGVIMLLAGLTVICFGSYYYIGSGLGCGPRDSLMVALGKRLPRLPIGMVRGAIEGTALFLGWLLGAKVGIGTVISVFGISFILQATFRALNFDVKAVEHESLAQTFARLREGKVPAN